MKMNLQGLKANMDGKDYQVTRVSGGGHDFLDVTLTYVNADSSILWIIHLHWSPQYGINMREPSIHLTSELTSALEYANRCRGV